MTAADLLPAPDGLSAELRQLHATARASLEANVVRLGERSCVTAGTHQFRSLWTRDFAHAAAGLLRIGRADVVRDHLTLLLGHRRPDGLLPRTLDSSDAKLRVAWASASRLVPALGRLAPALTGHLRPEFLDQHGQEAIDGNALAVLAAARLRHTGAAGEAWWRSHLPDLTAVHALYRRRLRGGLIEQPPFSDWQDSVRRRGATFYTNLVYWAATEALASDPRSGVSAEAAADLRARLEPAFRPDGAGLYLSIAGKRYVSLDGNLLAIDLGLHPPGSPAASALWEALVASPLWTRHEVPGFVTTPDYPVSWRNYGVVLAGLGHYHDRIRWSWLTALAGKVAARLGDLERAEACLLHLARCARRDGAIAEVYEERPPHRPWRSLLYHSEAPFAWGAAVTLDALHSYAEATGGPGA